MNDRPDSQLPLDLWPSDFRPTTALTDEPNADASGSRGHRLTLVQGTLPPGPQTVVTDDDAIRLVLARIRRF